MFFRHIALSSAVFILLAQPAVLSVPVLPVPTSTHAVAPSPQRLSAARQQYSQLPVSFEPNVGQAPASVRFLARTTGYRVGLLPNGALFAFQSSTSVLGKDKGTAQPSDSSTKTAFVQMQLVGANSQAQIEGISILPGKVNYLKGDDPSGWHTNVVTYGRVQSKGVYPGIDLIYHSERGQLEYDFVVAPKADLGRIRLRFRGAKQIFVDKEGALVVKSEAGQMRQLSPVVYEYNGTYKQRLQGRYVRLDRQTVGFVVKGHKQDRKLVIDPVLTYSTYLGGSGDESGNSIALDSSGNAYVTGITYSVNNFPTTPGAQQIQFGGGDYDAFVTKLNAAGSALVYSTYLGGSGAESGTGIAVDGSGNAYLTGNTLSTDFPITPDAVRTQLGNYRYFDAFVTKLNAAGNTLVYSTYLGGYYDDFGYSIAVDGTGNAYVSGSTASADFPITSGAVQTHYAGSDAFVTKLNVAGNALVYSTYLGGNDFDVGVGIAVDGSGNAYLTGSSSSTDFPTTPGAVQTHSSGSPGDAFVTKLNAAGTALVYSTYLGGVDGYDAGYAVAVDGTGNAYVTGRTGSVNFPTTPSARQTQSGGGNYDAFVTKLNAAGSALVYSTYLGGVGSDYGYSIALDGSGNAYVGGSSASTNFPTVNAIYFNSTNSQVGFVSKLNATGSALAFSTLLKNSTDIFDIAVDKMGNAYVSGETTSTNFPATPGVPQTKYGGGRFYGDAFVTKISLSTPLVTGFSPTSGPVGTAVTLTGTGFSKTSYVYFTNGKKAPFTVVSDTQLVVTVPVGATTAKIDVYVPFGKAQSPTAFAVTP